MKRTLDLARKAYMELEDYMDNGDFYKFDKNLLVGECIKDALPLISGSIVMIEERDDDMDKRIRKLKKVIHNVIISGANCHVIDLLKIIKYDIEMFTLE